MKNTRNPFNTGVFILGAGFIMAFGIFLYRNGLKEKKDFNQAIGKVIMYSDAYLDFKNNPPRKFLKIDTYDEVFDIYFPADTTNKNYIFYYNEIKIGDTLNLYFLINKFEKEQRVNGGMRFIDKKGKSVFYFKSNDKFYGLCFISLGVFIIGLMLLKHLK